MSDICIKSVESKINKLDREARILRAMILMERFFTKTEKRDEESLMEKKVCVDEIMAIKDSLGIEIGELIELVKREKGSYVMITAKKPTVSRLYTREQEIKEKWYRKGGFISKATNTGHPCKLCGIIENEMMIVENRGQKLHIMCIGCAEKLGRKMHNKDTLTEVEIAIVLSAKEARKNVKRAKK